MHKLKTILNFFVRGSHRTLDECTSFEIKKEESDTLYGGFKEYIPPIYEQDGSADYSFRTTDLLTDINHSK